MNDLDIKRSNCYVWKKIDKKYVFKNVFDRLHDVYTCIYHSWTCMILVYKPSDEWYKKQIFPYTHTVTNKSLQIKNGLRNLRNEIFYFYFCVFSGILLQAINRESMP